jgi:hypothetical protein
MAGNALPLAKVLNPSIGEAPDMVIRLALVPALSAIDTRNYGSVAKEVHLDVVDVNDSGFETRVFDLGKKFLFVGQFAVPFSIHKPARNQGLEGGRIAVDLSFVPQMLKNQQLALAWIGLLGG